jgi:IclR family KDG regulon transcriptional repressor
MKKPKGEYSIQAVINALRLLEEFSDSEELGVTELSRRLGLHKNNVFRLLATLEQRGYIEQSEEKRYRLGFRILELGRSFSRSRNLLKRARPLLVELAEQTGESAHLGSMHGFEVVHLDGVATDRLVGSGTRVGCRLPLHTTALGKVLLGLAPESIRESYDRTVVSRGLEASTSASIVDGDKFFEQLRSVASQGFAIDLGECEDGLCCAAAPVYDAGGELTAALSVSGPAFRMTEDRLLSEIVPLVARAADRLSRDLGSAI